MQQTGRQADKVGKTQQREAGNQMPQIKPRTGGKKRQSGERHGRKGGGKGGEWEEGDGNGEAGK